MAIEKKDLRTTLGKINSGMINNLHIVVGWQLISETELQDVLSVKLLLDSFLSHSD